MVKVQTETKFIKHTGREFDGFYVEKTLKSNVDNYLIAAVKNKFDGVVVVSGIEGAGKSTMAFTLAKYVDPTFPGEPLNDGSNKRTPDRIVFTGKQVMEAIDKAKPGQALVIDEAVLSMSASDYASDIQKLLIKKFVLIRKKRLFIFIVIPSVFMLRKYFAIFRTRALIHCTVNEGIHRGYFKFYSYDTKRKLYLRGMKEYDQSCVRADFRGDFTDTCGFFFNEEEYECKKDEAIEALTNEPDERKATVSALRKKIFQQRNDLIYAIYQEQCVKNAKYTYANLSAYMESKFGWEDGKDLVAEAVREVKNRTNNG
jgi:hypothetical protein